MYHLVQSNLMLRFIKECEFPFINNLEAMEMIELHNIYRLATDLSSLSNIFCRCFSLSSLCCHQAKSQSEVRIVLHFTF